MTDTPIPADTTAPTPPDSAQVVAAPPAMPPEALMMQLLSQRWTCHAVGVFAELGIADLLAKGLDTAEAIAPVLEARADAIYRLLRALTVPGLVVESPSCQFELTSIGQTLCSGHASSLRAMARWVNDPLVVRAWGSLDHAVKTGEPAFDKAFGMGIFDYYQAHPEAGERFEAALSASSENMAAAILGSYDFSSSKLIVDVGCGHGTLLNRILETCPESQGIYFDLPRVVEMSRPAIEGAVLGNRSEIVGGDFFDGLPAGGDAYVLKNIIHDWDDERSVQILENCRKAMVPGGKVLIVEMVIRPAGEPDLAKLMDLEMLVLTQGGRERTHEEYASLLDQAGLVLSSVGPTPSPFAVLEAIAAG